MAICRLFVLFLVGILGNDVTVLASSSFRPGEATETHSCDHVRPPPEEFSDPEVMRPNGVNTTFYRKYTEAYGIPILGSLKVSDDALMRACYTVRVLFAGHSGIRLIFYKLGGRFGIMGETEVTLDFPEFAHMDPLWNSRARGLGGTMHNPMSTGAEENVLCRQNDRYSTEDIFLHEASHGIDSIAAWLAIPEHRQAIKDAYSQAKSKGLWANTYAISNAVEYFAEGVQSYFDVNAEGREGGNGVHNMVNTRNELKDYDRSLFRVIKKVFPCDNTYLKRCESTRGMENSQVLQMNCDSGESMAPGGFLASLTIHDPDCRDSRPTDCLWWMSHGECDNTPNYMHKYCRVACKLCTPTSPTGPTTTLPPDCLDNNDNCKWWASIGECEKNPRYMLHNCKRSCKNC